MTGVDVLPSKHGAHEPQLTAEIRAFGHMLWHQVGVVHSEQHVNRSCLLNQAVGLRQIPQSRELLIYVLRRLATW